MPIVRVKKDSSNPYLIMNKTCLDDSRLSLKAKGLLCYLLSKPDNWYINYHNLVHSQSDGIHSVTSAFKELLKFCYIIKTQIRKNNGQYGCYYYTVFEHPRKSLSKIPDTSPKSGFPISVKPISDNQLLLINKNKIINKTPVTTLSNKPSSSNAVQDDPSLEGIKKYTITQLYELGIKDHNFFLDNFYIGDIFEYVEWILSFRSKIENPGGFLTSALKGRWLDSAHTKHL